VNKRKKFILIRILVVMEHLTTCEMLMS